MHRHVSLTSKSLQTRRESLGALAGAALALTGFNRAQAQESYPNRALNFIVPYPPGGNNDVVARAYAVPLAAALTQPVVIENRGGAAGAIGLTQAAKAAADGYNLAIGDLGTLCINPIANPNLAYDPIRDFVPVTTIANVSIVITGRKDLPANNLREFLNLAKSQPGKFRCGTAGSGSIGHLSLEMIKSISGVDILHVPYKGGAPALNDLLGGHIDVMIDGAAFNQAMAGAVKGLAVTGHRIAAMPNLPTVAESGVTDFYFSIFWGILMPARTPQFAIDRVGRELRKIGASTELKNQLEARGISVQTSTGAEFADLIRKTSIQISKVVKSTGIVFG